MGRKHSAAARKKARTRKQHTKRGDGNSSASTAPSELNENSKCLEELPKENVEEEEQVACETTTNDTMDCLPRTIDFYPFAYALYNTYLGDHCWYCLAPAENLRRCTGCSEAMFCNESCQKLGWKDHKAECKALRSSVEVPDIEVRLLGRIVTRFKDIKNGNDKKDTTFYLHRSSKRCLMDIWAHTDKIKCDNFAMQKFNDIYSKLVTFYGTKSILSKEEIFELHCRDYINRHAISDNAYLEEIGKGLYLDLCAYDHSCRPNTIYTCKGFVATLRALDRNVSLNDRSATFYSYINLLSSSQERKKLLKDTWYFDCQCARCIDNNDNIITSMLCPSCSETPERLCIFGEAPYKNKLTQILTCPKCHVDVPKEKVLEAIDAMRFVDRILEKKEIEQMPKKEAVCFLKGLMERFARILPNVNVYMCKIIQLLLPLIDPSDNETLLRLHLESEECVRFCYPPNHPAVGVHLSNIGYFFLRCGHPHRAELYLAMAYEIVKFTLGSDHAMTVSKYALLEEARREVREVRRIIIDQSSRFQVPVTSSSMTSKPKSVYDDKQRVETVITVSSLEQVHPEEKEGSSELADLAHRPQNHLHDSQADEHAASLSPSASQP